MGLEVGVERVRYRGNGDDRGDTAGGGVGAEELEEVGVVRDVKSGGWIESRVDFAFEVEDIEAFGGRGEIRSIEVELVVVDDEVSVGLLLSRVELRKVCVGHGC